MTGGLFGGYNKLQNAVYSRIDEANAIRLEKAAREYSDYMKNAYRLMNDPYLREIVERRIGDTAIPSAMRTASRETGEMNFGDVLPKKAGTVSAEQMYGVKLSQENKNEDFEQWAAREDAKKKKTAEEADKSSYVNTDTTGKTEEQIRVMEEFKNAVEPEVIEFVKEAENNPSDRWKKKDMGTVSERAANDIKNATGVDVSNFRHSMDVDFVSHVEKRHGKSGIQDHSMANVNDIARIGYVLENYDSITKGNLSPKYKNNDGSYAQTIVYEKAVDGSFYVVEAVPDSKAKKLRLITAYISKKTPSAQVAHANKSRESTPETSLHTDGVQGDVPSPNANIPQNGNGVNTLDAENSAAKVQQNSENAAKVQQRKPGTVSAEQMYGVKLSQENKNEDFEQWAEKEDAKKKKAAEKEAILAEKQKNADNSNLTNREKYSLSEQEVTEIKKGVSVITDADNNTIIDIKSNILENIPKEDWLKRVKNVIRSVFPKGFNLNGEHIDVSAKSRGEFVKSKDSVYLRDKSPEIYRDKMETAPHLDVISQNTEFQNVPPDHARTDNIVSFDKGRVNLKIGGNDYSAEVVIGVKDDGNKVFYDIVGMDANKRRPPSGSQSAQTANTRAQEPSDNISSNDSITDTSENFKSKSENSAAKVQQAETEEEARLRTLYESEPTGKYAGTEAGESKAELDEKVKEAKENAVGNDELKEKPKTEKQKILKRRIEKARLDMTVEEIVGFAQGLGRIKGFFGSERKDFARIFDDVSEGSRTIRNDLHKLLEVPHRQVQAQYTESYKNAVKAISDKFIIPSTFLFMPQNPFRHIPNRLLDGAWVVAEAPCGGLVAEHAV